MRHSPKYHGINNDSWLFFKVNFQNCESDGFFQALGKTWSLHEFLHCFVFLTSKTVQPSWMIDWTSQTLIQGLSTLFHGGPKEVQK